MSKKHTIVISVLLIIAAVVIQVLMDDSNTKLDKELIGFFSGILFGVGIGMPIHLFLNRKKKQ
ncbi:MAG: hypothetical protein AB7S48_13430 [Bacteroidales bacterium]